jgi:predicted RNase H-like nuclease
MEQRQATEKGFSVQAWNIVPKIREIDKLCQQITLRESLYEVHPELSFRQWSGLSVIPRKKSIEGITFRKQLIKNFFGVECILSHGLPRSITPAIDDLCDAYAALWTALRIHHGQAITLPDGPDVDEFGQRMQISI